MELSRIVEALVFASPEPLKPREIAALVKEAAKAMAGELDDGDEKEAILALGKSEAEDVEKAIDQLNKEYDETGRAFELAERASGWKLFSKSEYADWVAGLFDNVRPSRLSPPALESLAIIAYRQPVTKAAVEAVRGVSVDGVLNTLLERSLIKIAGRADLPGRPLLYETTESFLDHFGISDVEQLPNASELRTMKLPEPEEEKAAEPEKVEEQLVLSEVKKESGESSEDAPTTEENEENAEEPVAEEAPA
ncbi:MAG: SMC-Scp complex subunit ScpB [Verrucomicrobiota bacterium]